MATLTKSLPHGMESKIVLDSRLHFVYSGFQSLSVELGFRISMFRGIPDSLSRIPDSKACGKRLPPGIDSPQMWQRKRNNSRQIILTGPLIGLMAWNHSQRFKLNRSQLSRSHDWFTGSTTTTTQRLNLKSQALIVYTEHCMQMAYR